MPATTIASMFSPDGLIPHEPWSHSLYLNLVTTFEGTYALFLKLGFVPKLP